LSTLTLVYVQFIEDGGVGFAKPYCAEAPGAQGDTDDCNMTGKCRYLAS